MNMKLWRVGLIQKLFLLALLAEQILGVPSSFDCRFFIFHPECRGQYGKRTTLDAVGNGQQRPILALQEGYDADGMEKMLFEFCSRFVFHPVCRGVTSKRATLSPLLGNQGIYDLILNQIKNKERENKEFSRLARYSLSNSEDDVEDIEEDNDEDQKLPSNLNSHLKFRFKRDVDPDLLGTFTSFYKRRSYRNKRSAPQLDDLDTFTSFIKRPLRYRRATNDDLGLFTTFYKKQDNRNKRSVDLDDLEPFSTFNKRDLGNDLGSFMTFYKKNKHSRLRRQAASTNIDDLGAFTTFLKKSHSGLDDLDPFTSFTGRRKRSPVMNDELRNALGTFSSFMNPYHYYKRSKPPQLLVKKRSQMFNAMTNNNKDDEDFSFLHNYHPLLLKNKFST